MIHNCFENTLIKNARHSYILIKCMNEFCMKSNKNFFNSGIRRIYGLIFLYRDHLKKILLACSEMFGDAAINSQIGCVLHTKLRIHDDKLLRRGCEKFYSY